MTVKIGHSGENRTTEKNASFDIFPTLSNSCNTHIRVERKKRLNDSKANKYCVE